MIVIKYGGDVSMSAAGQYEIREDYINLTPLGMIDKENIEGIFYHELGHRY